jgi:hypothetical protein
VISCSKFLQSIWVILTMAMTPELRDVSRVVNLDAANGVKAKIPDPATHPQAQ